MTHLRQSSIRPRRWLTTAIATIVLAGAGALASGEALAQPPSPFELHEELRDHVRDALGELERVPERIESRHERHLGVFVDERVYHEPHRHHHVVYRFPVRIDGVVHYRPYTYCEGRLFADTSPRPLLWVEWGVEDRGEWCERCHGYYPHDHRHAEGQKARGRRGGGIPPGHLPPPGECRVWFDGRPPGRQPPPTDCATARREAARHGGRVIYGGSR